MTSIKTLLLFASLLFFVNSNAQSWLWARQGKNHTAANDGVAIVMDAHHNAFFTGNFSSDTMIFGTDTLVIKGPTRQAFIVKYDENGNLLWVQSSESATKSGDGNGQPGTYPGGIATDLNNNVIITGEFIDTVYFQSAFVENKYNPLVFVTKYDANGNVKWAKQCTRAGGRGNFNDGTGVITDKSGNVYVTGYFGDTVSFGSQQLTCPYQDEAFIVKYDSSGNVLWAKQSVGINRSSAGGAAITIDKAGYIYVTGNFTDTMSFGSQTLRTSYNGDVFIVKYDSNGNVIWAKEGNTLNQNEASSSGICADKNGNIYLAGYFADTLGFGTTTLISGTKYYSIFWAKYDSSGNVLWAKQSYDLDSMEWFGNAIKTDVHENLYLTGARNVLHNCNAKIVFDSDTLKQNNASDPFFFIKMDSSGTVLNKYLFHAQIGCFGADPLAVDTSGCYVYYGGILDTTVVFGSDTMGTFVNPRTISYPYIARWSDGKCTDQGVNTVENKNFTVHIYPNPSTGIFTIRLSVANRQWSVEVYNVMGQKVNIGMLKQVQHDYELNLSDQPNGVYFYRVLKEDGSLIGEGKIIVQK